MKVFKKDEVQAMCPVSKDVHARMVPDEFVNEFARLITNKFYRKIACKDFKGGRFPLLNDEVLHHLKGWYAHIDSSGKIRELRFEEEGVVAKYHPISRRSDKKT